MEHLRPKGQGIVPKGSKLEIRWNSKVGWVKCSIYFCFPAFFFPSHVRPELSGAPCRLERLANTLNRCHTHGFLSLKQAHDNWVWRCFHEWSCCCFT